MRVLKNILLYSNISLMILDCLYAGITIFAIIITCIWSSDTAVALKANVWYIGSIIIAILGLVLYFSFKKYLIVYGSNIIISILFLVAEYIMRKNPYMTRPEWFALVDSLPLIVAMLGITVNFIVREG